MKQGENNNNNKKNVYDYVFTMYNRLLAVKEF